LGWLRFSDDQLAGFVAQLEAVELAQKNQSESREA
jgi:hypothetical protein